MYGTMTARKPVSQMPRKPMPTRGGGMNEKPTMGIPKGERPVSMYKARVGKKSMRRQMRKAVKGLSGRGA